MEQRYLLLETEERKLRNIFSALNSLFTFTHQDHMTGRSFSFWKWYYGALDVVYRRLVDEWRDG